MKKYTNLKGEEVKLKVGDVKERKDNAYKCGSHEADYPFEFDFEREYWLKGQRDNERIREEIRRGDR